jgi:hypothetical protein
VMPVVESSLFASATIAIPRPLTRAADPAGAERKPEETLTSRVLTARPLNFRIIRLQHFEPASQTPPVYYYRGREEHLMDPEFAHILFSIRKARLDVRSEARAGGGFDEIEAARDSVRLDYARTFLETYKGDRQAE